MKDKDKLRKIRKAVAALYAASGCSCCRDSDEWKLQSKILGRLLRIPKYSDGSGYDFYLVARGRKPEGAAK